MGSEDPEEHGSGFYYALDMEMLQTPGSSSSNQFHAEKLEEAHLEDVSRKLAKLEEAEYKDNRV